MNLDRVKESLKRHEGVRNLPYSDPLDEDLLTIGCGHNLEVPITDRAIDIILEDDIQTAVDELNRVLPSWKEHSDNRQDVLIEMMFNLGAPRFLTFKNFIKDLSKRDYAKASVEMLLSKWAKQVGQRAITLSDRMLGG